MSTYSITNAQLKFTLTETMYCMDRLNLLVNVDTTHADYDHVNMMWADEQNKLINIKKQANKDGDLKVIYAKKEHGVGRLYTKPYSCHQNVYGPLRRILIDGNETSIDIKNAHATILRQLLKRYVKDKVYVNVINYVKNRDEIQKTLMVMYEVSKTEIKKLFISLSNGGGFKTWAKKNNVKLGPTPFINEYQAELTEISTTTAPKYFPNYAILQKIAFEKREPGDDDDKVRRCAFALYLTTEECSIMMSLCKCLKAKSDEFKLTSIIHDEVLFKGDVVSKFNDLIDDVNSWIKDETGFRVNFDCELVSPTDEDIAFYESHLPFMKKTEKKVKKVEHSQPTENSETIVRRDDVHANNWLTQFKNVSISTMKTKVCGQAMIVKCYEL